MKLTPAHKELIRLLAACAVETFQTKLLDQEVNHYEKGRPPNAVTARRAAKRKDRYDDFTPTRDRKKAAPHSH